MNKQNECVKIMVCVERRTQKKIYKFQMGFQPTTFRIIPRNIYIFKYSISILLLLEMLVEQ